MNTTVLATDKGNYFVNNSDRLFGFFNENGELLREASAREWEWAQGVMENASIDIVFDFSSLEEEKIKKTEEAVSHLAKLTGISEATVKKMINLSGAPAEELRYSGAMMPGWTCSSHYERSSMHLEQQDVDAWGVTSGGVISEIQGDYFSADYLARNYPEMSFFLVKSDYYRSVEGMRSYEVNRDKSWTIYKKPDMTKIWQELREAASLKIENFLKEVKNLPKKDFHSIVSSVIFDEEIIGAEEARISPQWIVEGVTTGNDLYSEANTYTAWAVNASGSLQKIDPIVITEDAVQNGRKHVDAYGYSYGYLRHEAPEAIFFLMKEEHSHTNYPYFMIWHLILPLTRKELMIQKINARNTPMTLGEMFPVLAVLRQV